jgi:hypothetical protein
MNERRLTREIYETGLGGNARRGRPRRTLVDQIEQVLEKGLVKITRKRRACMTKLMKVEEAKGVCKIPSKCQEMISAYPNGK